VKLYRIFFEQVNATHYNVEAENEVKAESKAAELWKEDNLIPDVMATEER